MYCCQSPLTLCYRLNNPQLKSMSSRLTDANHCLNHFSSLPGRIFEGQTSFLLDIASGRSALPVPLHFDLAETLPVTEVEECLTAFTTASQGGAPLTSFYLAVDLATCNMGALVTMESGNGSLVPEASYMFSSFTEKVGMTRDHSSLMMLLH